MSDVFGPATRISGKKALRWTIGSVAVIAALLAAGLLSKDASPPKQSQAAKEQVPRGPFYDVPKIRYVLYPRVSEVGWKHIGTEFYGSGNAEIDASGLVPSTFTYSISGATADRVDLVLMSAHVTAPGALEKAKQFVSTSAASWFSAMGMSAPEGLLEAIATLEPLAVSTDEYAVQFRTYRGEGAAIKQPDGSTYRSRFLELAIRERGNL